MKPNIPKPIYLLVLAMILASCVETYQLDFTANKKITIVESFLSNTAKLNPIVIKESVPSNSGGSNINYIRAAKVSVIINEKTSVSLTEKEDGTYYFPENFKLDVGNTYQLSFTTSNGSKYESTVEKMMAPPAIATVSHKIVKDGIKDAKGNSTPAYYMYVDTQDAATTEDFYMYEWELYEQQIVCQTCTGGYYYKDPLPLGRCVTDAILNRYNNIFDYPCTTPCWDIIKSSDLVITSDAFYNGKLIKAQFAGKIPCFTDYTALVNMKQYAISKGAFKFLELTNKQGFETGGLADTPPASLVGNVRCLTDPTENMSGYFIVAGIKEAIHTLDKKEVLENGLLTIGLLGGRPNRFEPASMNTSRPPAAPCQVSRTRTSTQPVGWVGPK